MISTQPGHISPRLQFCWQLLVDLGGVPLDVHIGVLLATAEALILGCPRIGGWPNWPFLSIFEGWLDKGARLKCAESRIEDRGSRIENRESRIEDRESRIENRGWRIEDRIENRGSRIEESRIEDQEPRI